MIKPAPLPQVTDLLIEWSNGNKEALDKLIPLVYEELRRLARHYMRRERAGHSLQTSALVNEAYIKLVAQRNVTWQNRAHFFAIAAQLMRRILIDHARMHTNRKRGGEFPKETLDETALLVGERASDLLALDDALKRLSAMDPRKAQVVELRYFGGLNIQETAEVIKVSAADGTAGVEDGKGLASPRDQGRLSDEARALATIDKLFQAALTLEPVDRAAFLDHASEGDVGLRREVESLLASHARAESFLSSPAVEDAAPLLADDKPDSIVRSVIRPLSCSFFNRRRRDGRSLSRRRHKAGAKGRVEATTQGFHSR